MQRCHAISITAIALLNNDVLMMVNDDQIVFVNAFEFDIVDGIKIICHIEHKPLTDLARYPPKNSSNDLKDKGSARLLVVCA